MRILTVLAKICNANAIKLMKLHIDSITMAIKNDSRPDGWWFGGAGHRSRWSSSVIRDEKPLWSDCKTHRQKQIINNNDNNDNILANPENGKSLHAINVGRK